MKLSQIAPIVRDAGVRVESADDLDCLVESPLLQACKEFFRKGIRTVGSSANCKDVRTGSVWIIIDAVILSTANLAIAQQAGRIVPRHDDTPGPTLILSLAVNSRTTVEEIEAWSWRCAMKFEKQIAGHIA